MSILNSRDGLIIYYFFWDAASIVNFYAFIKVTSLKKPFSQPAGGRFLISGEAFQSPGFPYFTDARLLAPPLILFKTRQLVGIEIDDEARSGANTILKRN